MSTLIFERENGSPGNGRTAKRYAATFCCCALLLFLVLPVAASAYTLVMRSGRRLEIPEKFTVAGEVLTYEAAPGILVTLQLSGVDITATERINNEAPGSLLRRAAGGGAEQRAATAQERAASGETARPARATEKSARRTITNRELERARRARTESEEAYERRAQELGLPSPEEARRRREAETQKLRELSRASEEEEGQAESYWRARAGELRTEIAVVDAQIDYLRDRLGGSPQTLSVGSYPVLTVIQPFFPFRPRGRGPMFRHPGGAIRPGVVTGGPQPGAAIGVGGGATSGQVIVNMPGRARNYFGRPNPFFAPGLIVPPFGQFAASYPLYDSSYERTVMVTRLRELEEVRAGLAARWRLLEDEARRAGAMPGWLRP
ncbi:MAG TPA: hypothetical protein VGX92_14275 [Pyrinomonadaceae bacterium]|jgi:hypothetical protein|nr:hypothetical protein [Pyrinomonadaceae bacterium]